MRVCVCVCVCVCMCAHVTCVAICAYVYRQYLHIPIILQERTTREAAVPSQGLNASPDMIMQAVTVRTCDGLRLKRNVLSVPVYWISKVQL